MAQPLLAAPRRRLLKIADQILDSMQDVDSSLGWAKQLAGGMMPVETVTGVRLSLKSGQMPADLSGAFMRVGPNVTFWPPKKRTHVFDGDGMVHSVRIKDGVATYNCDYLQTARLKIERELGHEWFTRVGEFHGKAGLTKVLAVAGAKAKLYGLQAWETSNANTAIACTPEGKLWALNEVGVPFHFKVDDLGAISSVGCDTFQGTHEMPISAHPKFDQRTGETFFHGREMAKGRFYAGRAVGGRVVERVELGKNIGRGFNHDMFITEKYVCMIDGSMRFDPKSIMKKKPLWNFKPREKLRFAIHPRSQPLSEDGWIWIEAPVAADIVHMLYAYDEGDKIVLWTPMFFHKAGVEEAMLGGGGPFKMHKLTIDLAARAVDVQLVPGTEPYFPEFGRIRDDRVGQPVRYGFSAGQKGQEEFNFTSILKWDFRETKLCGSILFPEHVVGGEPVLFPREGSAPDEAGDDGYIGMFLWNQETSESTFAIYDATSFASEPVAVLAIPRRVPLGFHAAWITEAQLQQQRAP